VGVSEGSAVGSGVGTPSVYEGLNVVGEGVVGSNVGKAVGSPKVGRAVGRAEGTCVGLDEYDGTGVGTAASAGGGTGPHTEQSIEPAPVYKALCPQKRLPEETGAEQL